MLLAMTAGGDQVQPDRQRIFNVPAVIVGLVGLMFGVHLLRQILPLEQNIGALINFSFVPGRFTYLFDPGQILKVIAAAQSADPTQAEIDSAFLNGGRPLWWTPITYAFLHANWAHVGFNALWLAAFGAPVARRFGNQRFIAFCIGGALAGALAHWLTHIDDLQPVIGASAIDFGDDGGGNPLHLSAGRAPGRKPWLGRSAAGKATARATGAAALGRLHRQPRDDVPDLLVRDEFHFRPGVRAGEPRRRHSRLAGAYRWISFRPYRFLLVRSAAGRAAQRRCCGCKGLAAQFMRHRKRAR